MVADFDPKIYQSFYTKSTPIVEYMVNNLQLKQDDKIFEPCGGDGEFINAILGINESAAIDVFELNPSAVEVLLDRFSSYENVKIQKEDTLLSKSLIINSRLGGVYDKIIANPPYGAWQDLDKKSLLKEIFPNLNIKETYALFLFRCIELLKEDGILSFIIPDTFLNLHTHKSIRSTILKKTKILELALFPSSFFPGVNFGYANLSIITLQKNRREEVCLNNTFEVITDFSNVDQLVQRDAETLVRYNYTQQDVFSNPDHAFLISNNVDITYAINHSELKIGDIAKCVTGFYSGNDKRFLKVLNKEIRNSKHYEVVEADQILYPCDTQINTLEGADEPQCFIPIVKGGNVKFLKTDAWFMDWSKESVLHYKKDKKARFQNPSYYFKYGIGVPMISSSSITAAIIENKLFDQSIVGIFPNDEGLVHYLLAFFNSPTCNKLIRTINPSANNPSNYIKKIPFITPNENELHEITSKVKSIVASIKDNGYYDENIENEVNEIIKGQFGF